MGNPLKGLTELFAVGCALIVVLIVACVLMAVKLAGWWDVCPDWLTRCAA